MGGIKMIIKEIIMILGKPIYRNYSDKNVYIRNKETGLLWSDVNSLIDYEYEETDFEIKNEHDIKVIKGEEE
jgi:hypothetical protein